MTPRARLVVPGLLGLGLALGITWAASPAAADVSPPCNERTSYVDCRRECIWAGGLQCACTWDSVSDVIGPFGDICSGQNEDEAAELACLYWDAEKYPDQPFCTPSPPSPPCDQRNTLDGCTSPAPWTGSDRCLVFTLNGEVVDPGRSAWDSVSQDECECNWDFPAFDYGFGLQCDTLKDELQDTSCLENPTASDKFCSVNPLVHCVAPRCDVDANGRIDSVDVNAIYARLGQAATDACDPADPTESGQISIVDASQCSEQCTYANCRTSPPSSCGLGIELALALPVLLGLRSRVRARTAG